MGCALSSAPPSFRLWMKHYNAHSIAYNVSEDDASTGLTLLNM